MTLPEDLRPPETPHDWAAWPARDRAVYIEMVWSRAEIVAVLLDHAGQLDEERTEKIRAGQTRLTIAELSAIVTETRAELSR